MGADELLHAERFQLCGSPSEMLVVGSEQMQSADHRFYRRRVDRLARVLKCVDNAGMAAAEYVDQSLIGLNHERHVFGHGVFDVAGWTSDSSCSAPVSPWMHAVD